MKKKGDELKAVLEHFITVFNNLEWEEFIDCFSDDATVFSPFAEFPRRTTVAESFKTVFETGRTLLPGPPYLNIAPSDLIINSSGDFALVTFHLSDLLGRPELHRRTLVFRKIKGQWRICHLHASIATPVETGI